MNRFKNFAKSLWKDESAQGATEYILLLVVVVAIAVIFKDKIKDVVTQKTSDVGNSIQSF